MQGICARRIGGSCRHGECRRATASSISERGVANTTTDSIMVVVNNRSSIVLGIGVGIGVDDFLLAAPSVGVAILQESYCKRHLDIESVATGRRNDAGG